MCAYENGVSSGNLSITGETTCDSACSNARRHTSSATHLPRPRKTRTRNIHHRNPEPSSCEWERLGNLQTAADQVVESGNWSDRVTIASSDVAFYTSGCGTWTLE